MWPKIAWQKMRSWKNYKANYQIKRTIQYKTNYNFNYLISNYVNASRHTKHAIAHSSTKPWGKRYLQTFVGRAGEVKKNLKKFTRKWIHVDNKHEKFDDRL